MIVTLTAFAWARGRPLWFCEGLINSALARGANIHCLKWSDTACRAIAYHHHLQPSEDGRRAFRCMAMALKRAGQLPRRDDRLYQTPWNSSTMADTIELGAPLSGWSEMPAFLRFLVIDKVGRSGICLALEARWKARFSQTLHFATMSAPAERSNRGQSRSLRPR